LWDDYRTLAIQSGLRACWSIPILSHEGTVLGSFAMYYTEVRSLHLEVIAEGVETGEQAFFLGSHGCLSAQGNYYGKPVASDAFAKLL